MMQGSEASFASPAAQTSAEGRRRICIMQLKRACQADRGVGHCFQQSQVCPSSFIRSLCQHMMQGSEANFASPAAQTSAEGRRRICIMQLKRACQAEPRRWPLHPAESGLPVKLHQESLSTYDAKVSLKQALHLQQLRQALRGADAFASCSSKGHVRLNRGDGHCFQQSQVCLSSFIRSLYQHMMQGSEASFASPAAQTSAEGRRRICIMQLKRACQAEPRRWPLLPAESGLPVKLHQESLSTYDARVRSKLCISSSSDKR